MASVTIQGVSKRYPNGTEAVKNFSLDIRDGEFVVIVGPSGCGKSTILRMVAGLEEITQGDLYIDSCRMNNVAAKDRNISMVFQNYALLPHLNVFDNIAFGLKIRKTPKAERKQKVLDAARMLGIEHLLKYPLGQLSGGERQRVAMGRAIVRDPAVFLMDEPLSNLDAKLRTQMRAELTQLHQRLGTTFIYVTHDQTEAMTMGERIVVMDNGVIQQVGTPEEVYNCQSNRFVAGFIGTPPMNFFRTEQDGAACTAGVRPEHIQLCGANTPGARPAKVDLVEFLGAEKLVYLNMSGETIIMKTAADTQIAPKQAVFISWNETHMHIYQT